MLAVKEFYLCLTSEGFLIVSTQITKLIHSASVL
jgi:hypothetical protein